MECAHLSLLSSKNSPREIINIPTETMELLISAPGCTSVNIELVVTCRTIYLKHERGCAYFTNNNVYGNSVFVIFL